MVSKLSGSVTDVSFVLPRNTALAIAVTGMPST